uniref:Glutathione S-transferase mu 3 n=1 Tax=Callithrix jacchus TaxID=9483 RepID=A0A8I3X3K5_CALJA
GPLNDLPGKTLGLGSPGPGDVRGGGWGRVGAAQALTRCFPQLAHAIRLLLEFTDTSYEEKRYTCGEAPDYDRSQWLDVKFKLNLDFPNVSGFRRGDRQKGSLQIYPSLPGTTGRRHHAQLIFVFLVETGFCHVIKADPELLGSNNPPTSAFQTARITGMSHCAQPEIK